MRAILRYDPSISSADLQNALSKAIVHRRQSTFMTHFRVPFESLNGYQGDISNATFKAWQYDPPSNWYHVILEGEIADDNGNPTIIIQTKRNPMLKMSQILANLILLFIAYLNFPPISDFSILNALLLMILIVLPNVLINTIVRIEAKAEIEYFNRKLANYL